MHDQIQMEIHQWKNGAELQLIRNRATSCTFINTGISIGFAVRCFAASTGAKSSRRNCQSFNFKGFSLFWGHTIPWPCRSDKSYGLIPEWHKDGENKGFLGELWGQTPTPFPPWLPWQHNPHTAAPFYTYKFSYSNTWSLTGLQDHLHMLTHVLTHAPVQTNSNPAITPSFLSG